MRIVNLLLVMAVSAFAACNSTPTKESSTDPVVKEPTISQEAFGQADNLPVDLYTLTNANGIVVKITNYGGIVTSIITPDKNGQMADIALGFDSLAPYMAGHPFFGAIVGRYGNRIAKGKFTLDGKEYSLAANNMGNHLHGGMKGFDKVVWQATAFTNEEAAGLKLNYLSKDGEEGYPGNLNVTVTYRLNNDNELKIDYEATTDKATVVNLTNHSYFNLTGGTQDILAHELKLVSDQFLPVDETLIPTGAPQAVEGTPFDFRQSTPIGARVNAADEQIKRGLGYDHCWVLNRTTDSLELAAEVYEPGSGRTLEVLTTEPAIQFYCGNFLDGTLTGKNGVVYKHRSGLCLETEHYPDSPNQSAFPSVTLQPGEAYRTQTVYKFGVK